VRSFGCLSLLRCEDYFEGVCNPEVDPFRQRFMFDKSARRNQSGPPREPCRDSYFSLRPPPAPVPLPCTETVASLKPHDAAAQKVTTDKRRRSCCNGRRESCMASVARKIVL
jgi:hypothetical protein